MSRKHTTLRDYIDHNFAPEDALLQRVRAAGEERRAGMQISAGEGKLLYMFATLIGAKRILEVGCFMGYSAISMARALPEGGELITLEYNDDYADVAQSHFDESNLPIQLIRGKALDSIAQLQGEFDLIFIDADKANYAHYLEASLPLLRAGGLMIGDNTLLFGAMLGEAKQRTSEAAIAAMRAFNARMNDSAPLEGVMIPTEEGLTIAQKRA
jgi:predicted O-methyltransferase YrrM